MGYYFDPDKVARLSELPLPEIEMEVRCFSNREGDAADKICYAQYIAHVLLHERHREAGESAEEWLERVCPVKERQQQRYKNIARLDPREFAGVSGNLEALEAVSYGPLGDSEPEQAVRRLWRRLLPDVSSDPTEVGRLKDAAEEAVRLLKLGRPLDKILEVCELIALGKKRQPGQKKGGKSTPRQVIARLIQGLNWALKKLPEEDEEESAAVWILLKPVVQTVLGRLGVTLEDLICTRVQIVKKGNKDEELGARVPPPENSPDRPVQKQHVAEQPEQQTQPEQPKQPEEQRVYQREVDEPPEEEEEKEPWHTVVARMVVAHLLPGEPEVMAGHLLQGLIGQPPAEFLGMVRAVGARMRDVPQNVRVDLKGWLIHAGHWNYETRLAYLFNFLMAARLPQWRLHLHLLREANVPPGALAYLEPAWNYYRLWRIDGQPDGTPLPSELATDPEEAARLRAEEVLYECVQRVKHFTEGKGPISVLAGAEGYEALADLREAMERALAGSGAR